MEIQKKNILPSPCFKEIEKPNIKIEKTKPCLAVPQGDLLPMGPPMYGPRGSTIPPRFLGNYQQNYKNQGRNEQNPRGFRNFNNHQGNRNSFQNYQNRQRQTAPIPHAQQNFTQQFWCETCDRPFNTSAQLESHKYEHQICGIDDCMFIGHPSVVTKHIEAQHTTGLYQKIKNLSTPEEIAKWREERIKRYPTKANVELRQKAQAERTKRGEKLSENKSKFGQKNDRRQMNGGSKFENFRKEGDKRGCKERHQFNKSETTDKDKQVRNNSRRKRKKVPRENKHTDIEKHVDNIQNKEGIFNGNLKMFEGTLQMPDYHHEKIKNVSTNALTSLLSTYGSSSDSDTNDDEQEIISNEKNDKENDYLGTAINNSDEILNECDKTDVNMLDTCTKINVEEKLSVLDPKQDFIGKLQENVDSDMPDEEPIVRKPENELLPTNTVNSNGEPSTSTEQLPNKRSRTNRHEKSIVNKRKKHNTLLDYSKLKTRRPNTMLEKLLESDIRHERNVLLQCVRHVVKKNFFGIGQKYVTN